MLRVLDIILFTFAPLNRLEYLIALLLAILPDIIGEIALWGRAPVGFPFAVTWLLSTATMIYSFVFSIRRLLDVGIATKAEAFFWILGFSTIANLLAVGIGKPTLLVTYAIYYGGLLLWPSAKPRPMWTQDLRQ
jgi:hypothetical protein